MTNTDKEILDILKGIGMSDDDIKDAIEKGNIKLGAEDNIEKGKKEDSEETEVNVTVEEGEEDDDKKKDKEEEDEKVEKGCDKKIEKSEDEKDTGDKIEKSDNSDLIKSFEDKFKEVDELQKSISGLTAMLTSMNDKIEKISNEAPEPKSVRNVQYFEKGATLKDEEERTILSASDNREELGEVMLKSIGEETDDVMKSQIESDLMNVIAGNGMPSKAVSQYMFEKRGVRITK